MAPNSSAQQDRISTQELTQLKAFLLSSLVSELETASTSKASASSQPASTENYRNDAARRLEQVYERANVNLDEKLRSHVFRQVLDELVGYGPIQPFLDDAQIAEIMVNGPQHVFIERNGELIETGVKFQDDAHVLRIINRMIHPLGRRVDADSPTVDARLPDGSRVNVVIPPVSIDGPCISIRKFLPNKITMEELVVLGSITEHMVEFLRACVAARLNILISGGTSSGKTTMLNILSGFIPGKERIITIEDAVELQLQQRHVVRLETKPPNVDGFGAVTTRDLVRNALRMRPDRIIVGEVRSGEALDMLQAMNTGHTGSLTTLHSNTPRDAISRLETMTLMAGLELPILAIRKQMSSAFNLIVHQTRLPDGARKTTQITEVFGMEGEVVTLSDIFKFEQTGVNAEGKILGELRATGIRPMFTPRLEVVGYRLRGEIFGAGKSH